MYFDCGSLFFPGSKNIVIYKNSFEGSVSSTESRKKYKGLQIFLPYFGRVPLLGALLGLFLTGGKLDHRISLFVAGRCKFNSIQPRPERRLLRRTYVAGGVGEEEGHDAPDDGVDDEADYQQLVRRCPCRDDPATLNEFRPSSHRQRADSMIISFSAIPSMQDHHLGCACR